MGIRQAMQMAEETGVDLVEIAPLAQPPVCRIMDYGKFKYQEQKRQHEQKLKQKQVQVKEVKLRPGTDENDYQIKLRNLKRFLDEGDKCKVTLRFRGREMAHSALGADVLKIDGMFIRNLVANREDQVFVRAIVEVARGLGKKTVAEFVGDAETLALLGEIGVDYAQGYYLSFPIAEISAS